VALSESTCFLVQKDSQADELLDTQFESFEQLLSAMDGADIFGSRLCNLVSEELAKQLTSEDFASRFASSEDATSD
ncbi:unnamed protein product, partial [Polarella glacialis]